MDDRDVILVEDYIKNCTSPPKLDPKNPFIFDLNSYSRWADDEILIRVMREAMKLPAHITGKYHIELPDIIECFIDEMDYYMQIATTDRSKEMFEIARDEGKCMLLYICSAQ